MGNVKRAGEGVGFANPYWAVTFDGGRVELGRLTIDPEIVLRTGTQELSFSARDVQVSIEDGVLARIVVSGQSPRGDSLRLTYDVHETENLHLYVRLEWGQPIEGGSLELPRLRIAGIRQVTFPDAATVEPPAEMPRRRALAPASGRLRSRHRHHEDALAGKLERHRSHRLSHLRQHAHSRHSGERFTLRPRSVLEPPRARRSKQR